MNVTYLVDNTNGVTTIYVATEQCKHGYFIASSEKIDALLRVSTKRTLARIVAALYEGAKDGFGNRLDTVTYWTRQSKHTLAVIAADTLKP